MVLAVHQREREGGDTTQSIRERRRVREGTSTPAQEDQVLVGFGDFASMCFKDLYEATDSSRKGYGSPNRLLLITFRVQTRSLCFNLDWRHISLAKHSHSVSHNLVLQLFLIKSTLLFILLWLNTLFFAWLEQKSRKKKKSLLFFPFFLFQFFSRLA